MVDLAFSTIALPAYDQASYYPAARDMGFIGLEVAPSRIWADTARALSAGLIEGYRRTVEDAGLRVVGLHSLFFDQPGLGLFRDRDVEDRTLDFLVHLSAVCRDLGGQTLIFGSPAARRRGALSPDAASDRAVEFFSRLCRSIEPHGTCICLEPLTEQDSDFANRLSECLAICRRVGSAAMGMQIDARAVTASGEIDEEVVVDATPLLVHVHANQLDLGVLCENGGVDHRKIGRRLRDIGYSGFVSAETRMMSESDPLGDLSRSADILRRFYA